MRSKRTYFPIFLFALCCFIHGLAFGQWRNMSRFTSYGVVNYHTQVRGEKNAKRIIMETVSANSNFEANEIAFNKDKNLFVNEYMVDPLNHNYVYVIHAIRGITGDFEIVNLFFYYIENRLRYFYEIDDRKERVVLMWDPAFMNPEDEKE